jgi:hypothetical protein
MGYTGAYGICIELMFLPRLMCTVYIYFFPPSEDAKADKVENEVQPSKAQVETL